MKLSILTYPLSLTLLLSTHVALGQTKKDAQPTNDKKTKAEQSRGTISEEIDVVRPYKPSFAEAVKIRINPDLTNNPTFRPNLIYTVLDKTLQIDSNITKLQSQKLFEDKVAIPTNNYIKAAIGNLNTTLGELYLNNGKDEALQVGLAIKHLAQQGNINKQQFSRQEATLFGRNISNGATLDGHFTYNRLQTYFYGLDPAIASTVTSPAQQQFNLFEARGGLQSNYKQGKQFGYKLDATGYLLNNHFDAKENNLFVSASLNQAINKVNFGAQAAIDVTKSEDVSYTINNNIFRAHPYAKIKGNNASLNFGLYIIQQYGMQNKSYLFPTASINFPLAKSYVTIFAGANGDVIKASLRELANENPYLNTNAAITNTIEKLNIYAGIKGNAGHALGFKATAFYKQIENMQLFQNSPSAADRFDVIYDPGQSKVLGIMGELELKASTIFSLINKIQVNNYTMANEQKAWFKPALRLTSIAQSHVTKRLSLNAEVVFNSQTYAKTVNTSTAEVEAVRINDYVDLNAGAEFQFAPQARVYLQATNILGTTNQQYLYYSKLGLGIFGGLKFSF